MSRRLRLALWNVGVIAIALLLLGVLLRAIVAHQTLAQLDRELDAQGRFVQTNIGLGIPRDIPPTGLAGRPILHIYNREGLSVARKTPAPDPAAIIATIRDGKHRFTEAGGQRLLTLPLDLTQGAHAFQVGLPLARVDQQVRAATQALVTLIPFAIAVAAGLSIVFADRSLRPLEASLERQRRFTADASHELRTPLSIVKAAAQLGRTAPGGDDETRGLFERIERTVDRTSDLVANLVLIARNDADQLPVHPEPIPMAQFLESLATEMRSLHPDGPTVRVEPTDAILVADPLLLAQLVQNLLANSLRNTPDSGSVTLSATVDTVQVRDNGIGIPAEHLPHLTERFYRVDSARGRKTGGVGLGLAICQAVVHAHGGVLTIQSEPGAGTTVTATFPWRPDSPIPHSHRSRKIRMARAPAPQHDSQHSNRLRPGQRDSDLHAPGGKPPRRPT